ncbi:MAG: CPBP family intramembrane metalloprotease [Lachnospiraceae bacterium]|nr:CPBP family intramembrane metalloprotease [Lachnospiraceae bacterium]
MEQRISNLQNKPGSQKILALGISLALVIIFMVILKTSTVLLMKLPIAYWYYRLLVEIIAAALAVGAVFLTGNQSILKEKGRPWGNYAVPVILIVLYFLVSTAGAFIHNLTAGSAFLPLPQILSYITTILLVGIAEEFLFRGAIMGKLMSAFNARRKSGAYVSVFISGFLFGLVHISNIINGTAPISAVLQAISAMGIGFVLGALYYRSRNIWLMAALHAMIDMCALISSGVFATGETLESTLSASAVITKLPPIYTVFVILVLTVPTILITCFMLRNRKNDYETSK